MFTSACVITRVTLSGVLLAQAVAVAFGARFGSVQVKFSAVSFRNRFVSVTLPVFCTANVNVTVCPTAKFAVDGVFVTFIAGAATGPGTTAVAVVGPTGVSPDCGVSAIVAVLVIWPAFTSACVTV